MSTTTVHVQGRSELVFDDGQVQLWHGRLEDVLPTLGVRPVAARNLGRRAIGIEMREDQCVLAARRLEQGVLSLEGL